MLLNLPATFREYMVLERRRTSDEGITVADWQRWVQLKRILDRQFQQALDQASSDRREDSVRVPTRLRVGFESYGEIREFLMSNVSRGGLFISTPSPLPLGTKLRIQIRIEKPGELLDLQGEVAWHNTGPGLVSEELGMGIQFVRLTPEEEKAVDNLYERSLRKAIAL
jgi:uncharacterized protein (TIGR02266 family)